MTFIGRRHVVVGQLQQGRTFVPVATSRRKTTVYNLPKLFPSAGNHGLYTMRRMHCTARALNDENVGTNGQWPNGLDRMFSNINSMTKRHEPGSVLGAALLVAGTTVGAGMLAIPAITEPAGFTASATALVGCCAYSIVTGLLFAEVSMNTMASQGAGNVSLVSMVKGTLGTGWQGIVGALYVFQHYSLLVAYIAKAGEIVSSVLSLPLVAGATLFAVGTGLACYALPGKQLDTVNGLLVAAVVASFLALVVVVLPGVDISVLGRADWSKVPDTLPVIALAFVYQNVVPVVVKDLEGDPVKVRSALIWGSALPLTMFLAWEASCLGAWESLSAAAQGSTAAVAAGAAAVASAMDPATANSGMSSAITSTAQMLAIEPSVHSAAAAAAAASQQVVAASVQAVAETAGQTIVDPVKALSDSSPVLRPLVNSFSLLAIITSYIGFCLGLSDFLADAFQLGKAPSTQQTSSEASTPSAEQGTPTTSITTQNSQEQIQATSSSSTSSSSSVLDVFRASPQSGRLLTFSLAVLPPLGLALTFPDIFFAALDIAGTYGVMTLFGLLPAGMAWLQRYGGESGTGSSAGMKIELVPGGKLMLGGVGGFAVAVIVYELAHKLHLL